MAPEKTDSLVMLAVLAAACAGPRPCGPDVGCPAATVCQVDGRCAPLADETGQTRTEPLAPVDWAVTRADRPNERSPDLDVLELGGAGDAAIHLRFDDIPPRARVRRAVLELYPEDGWSGPGRGARVVVHRTLPFTGRQLTRRRTPNVVGAPVGERHLPSAGPRALLVDVTPLVRHAQRMGRTTVHVVVRRVGGPASAWRWASPRATDPERRPRLLLVAR